MIAVDLFKEGTDAPGIRNLIMWKDINSLISFVQILGRGLRPDQFKEYLEVVDIAGVFRKLHLLQWLGNFAGRSDESSTDKSDQKDRERVYLENTATERPLCQLAEDVSHTVADFMKNIPGVIARRYPGVSYSAIPSEALIKLHEFVAERCGFENTFAFETFLSEEGAKLMSDNSATTEKLLRDKLLPAFMIDPSEVLGGYKVLERSPEMLLVHAHLSEMFQVHCNGFTPEHFARVFPEFSKEALDLARVIGGNLATLRRTYFNLDMRSMAQELVDKVLSKGLLNHDEFAELHLRFISLTEEDCVEAFATAEGRRPSGQRTTSVPEYYDQVAITKGLVNHPDIKGKLIETDFKLPRIEFENLLIEKGLITLDEEGGSLRRDFTKLLDRKVEDLLKVLESGESLKVGPAIEVAKGILLAGSLVEYFQENSVSQARYQKVADWLSTLQTYSSSYPSLQPIITTLEKVRDAMVGLDECPIRGSGKYLVRSYQLPDSKSIELIVSRRDASGEVLDITQVSLPFRNDLPRPHILLDTKSVSHLEKCKESLPPNEQENFQASLISLLEKMNLRKFVQSSADPGGGKAPIFIIPKNEEEASHTLLYSLSNEVLACTSLQVMVGGPHVSYTSSYKNLEPTVDQVMMTRTDVIHEDSIKTLRQQMGKAVTSFAAELKHLYEVTHFVRTRIAPHSATWEKTLKETEKLPVSDLRYAELAREPYEKIIKGNAAVYPKLFASLKTYCSLLDGIYYAGGLTSHTALLISAWRAWNVFPLGSYEQRNSPVREINGAISLLFARLTSFVETGITLPDQVEKDVNAALEILFNTFFSADKGRPLMFPNVSQEEQGEYASQLLQRLNTLTATLTEMKEVSNSQNLAPSLPEINEERKEGHPFFNINDEPVFFLSGSKKAAVMHLDPDCAKLKADLEKRKKKELPQGPVTEDSLADIGLLSEKVKCCDGCKMPTKTQREQYSDIRKRFFFREGISVRLPNEYITQ